MRKTYLAKRNALLAPSALSVSVVLFAIVIAGALVRLAAPSAFLAAMTPLLRAGTAVARGASAAGSVFADAASLQNANALLASDNAALATENRALTDKVASLSALLGDASAPPAAPGIVLGVLASPPASPYDTLVVDGGAARGVALGMEAFGTGGTPIGVVSSVEDAFARITLFSAPGESLAGWVGDKHLPLTLAGAGAGAFTATAPRAAAIATGDIVYAPGPGALPIGSVAKEGGDPAAPFVVLSIAPAVNPATLTWIVVRDEGAALRNGALVCATTTPS